ncbi:hypothetical protein [Rosistilla oblonga]|uniref:hypothetical protein n=1 Tax=Rosistilla oblonga TaxID=2527990 RepID=UPI003A9721C3
MLFSVIYSVDVPSDESIDAFAPPTLDLWDETEDDDQYQYDYLEGEWENGHHRKWCGLLDRTQFQDFVDHCGLMAEDTETMGSLGAPGLGFGVSPAISFTSGDPCAIQSVYVTLVPETKCRSVGLGDWERVKSAVVAVYG